MSRIAKKPIQIPEKTSVDYNGGILTVKGPLGELKKNLSSDLNIKIEGNEIMLSPSDSLENYALWGTFTSHIKNMLKGVNAPVEKKLIVEGIGYKADVKGEQLHLALGFSHPVVKEIPKDLKVTTEKNVITVSGIDSEKVGRFAAEIRSMKKPEPYKGKGIRYADEVIRRKQGKKSV